ncbi:FAD/NAD(P)-binding domain-containing protein [Cadophora sp. DSE1049]|nr:FAD/NAD(P)-binding domain-containing protein [Cadophora sp. DSE1049]
MLIQNEGSTISASLLPAEVPQAAAASNSTTNGIEEINGVKDTTEEPQKYHVPDQWFGKRHFVKVIGLGSGLGGMVLSYKLRRALQKYQLTIYERSDRMSGTWWNNTYPGVACDIPAHVYTYSFRPNTDWSTFYAYGKEIFDYSKTVGAEFGSERDMVFNREVIKIEWDEAASIWNVTLKDPRTGELSHDWCHIFLNSGGRLTDGAMPTFPGLENFQGPVMHSSKWDHTVDFKDKTAAVIGNGSSAIQIVPQLQKICKKVVCYMRSETWISPPIGLGVARVLQAEENGEDTSKIPTDRAALAAVSHSQMEFSEKQQKRFREDPAYHLKFRKEIEGTINAGVDLFIRGTKQHAAAYKAFKEGMTKRIGPGFEDLKEKLIPSWSPGCRRLTPGDGYLEALTQPNVELIFEGVSGADERGLISTSGKHNDLDVVVCATGFKIPFQPHFEVVGRNGLKMKDAWDPDPNCYLGIAGPGFPNYWVIMGPRGPWGNGSVIPAMETSCEYFAKVINKMQMEGIQSIEPRQDATDELMEHIDAFHEGSVWTDPCRSWYKKGQADGRPWLWSGSAFSYLAAIKEPRYEDYIIKYKNHNRWAYLGNGRMKGNYAELYPDHDAQFEALTPYIRNEDVDWQFDY